MPFYTIAQQPFSYKLDYENGFQSNEVYEVEQDSFGFIWIGCDAGIFRYDGVQFKQYAHSKQNGVSLSNLIIDKQQRVWCQNFTGQIFYIENDSIHLFKDFTKVISSFPNYFVSKNECLVTMNDSTSVYDIATKKLKVCFRNKHNIYERSFSNLNFIKVDNRIYANSRANLHYKVGKKPFKTIFELDKYYCFKLKEINDKVYAMLQEVETKDWLFVQLEQDKIVKQKRFPTATFSSEIYMIEGMEAGFIVCTTEGVYLLDADFNVINHYFPKEKITDALLDKEKNLWLASIQNGIFIIPSIDLNIFSNDFFLGQNITTLAKEDNRLLLGTDLGNIFSFNPKTATYQDLNVSVSSPYKKTRKIISNDNFRIFSIGESTVAFNKKTKKQVALSPGNIRDMTLVGDTIFTINGGVLEKADLKGNLQTWLFTGAGRMITKQPNSDTVYFSNKNGFFYYAKGKVVEVLKNNQAVYPLCAAWQQDTLWLGTIADGFLAYHNGQFFHHYYKQNDGNRMVVRAVQIDKNWLFLATNLGLIRMDLTTKAMEIIGTNEGLYQKEITAIEVIDKEVFLATTNSLIRFPVNIKAKNTAIPNITLNEVLLNDSVKIDFNKNQFVHNENNLRFQFQTVLFRSRQNFHYEYRLIGLNENWQTTNATSPFAQYRSLKAGDYTFEVRAVNEDEVKSKIESFSFSIALPIWKRWWFVTFVILILATFIYWLFTKRLNDIQQKAKLENELKSSQLTALKAQMNPHFLYNSLNSIQDLILQEDVENASEYLTKFSHLMRQILEASEYFEIPLNREIQILELYLSLEKLRFGKKFQYEIQLPNQLNLQSIKVPSMVIQPFIENAVKHGLLHKTDGIKQLNINFELQDLLICTIIDNGIGRAASAKIKTRQGKRATSFATSATRKRLDILNQTHQQKIGLEIIDLYEKSTAIGTKVILRIPFSELNSNLEN